MDRPDDVLAEFASPGFLRDPHPLLQWLRENEPVHRTRAGYYLVSRHTDADRVLRKSGTEFRGLDPAEVATLFPQASQHPSLAFLAGSLASKNPPEHTRLRRSVARAFTPRHVNTMRGEIEAICERLIRAMTEALNDGEVVDLHSGLSRPMTVDVISTLLGVPEADRDWLAESVDGIVRGFVARSVETIRTADDSTVRLEEYFRELMAQRRHEPRDDLLSLLVGDPGDGEERLSDEDVFPLLGSLWIAGFGSTAAGIDFGVLAMAAYPDERGHLLGGHDKTVAFVNEVARHAGGPFLFTSVPRIAVTDIELSGVRIRAGSDVRPLFAAANRDPAVFPEPDRFLPGRDNSRTLAFGAGIHSCLGAFLARDQIAIALSRLYDSFPGLMCAGAPQWGGTGHLRFPLNLPVSL
ncbi:cytochrome P450 [Streptomyces phyllanthi]|nr:cytochrome P450 [Streptomyces phyllanthi]